jgi:hypothetical protein
MIDPFSTTMSAIYFTVFFLLFPSILYIKFNGSTNFIELIINGIKHIYDSIEKLLLPIFRFLNPYPFQSMLLQFFVCYLIFFAIFITHPFPILKRYPTAVDSVLYSFLGVFLLTLFIQFVVPFSKAGGGKTKQPSGFVANKYHLKKNLPIYLGLLASIAVIILLAVTIAYLGAHHTRASWVIMTGAVIIMCVSVLVVLATFLSEFTGINIPSPSQIFNYFISKQMLSDLVAYLKNSIDKTPASIYILLAFEISYLIAYFLLPLLGNAIYLKDPGNKDYNWLLKKNIRGLRTTILSEKEHLQFLENGIEIDWTKAESMSDLDLRTALYDVGYTVATEPAAAALVRQNQDSVMSMIQKIGDLEDKMKSYKAEEKINKDYSSKQLLREPIYTDSVTKLGSFEDLKVGDDYNYQYTLSAWVFVHNQPPNFRYSADVFTSLLNYGDKPNILYNIKEQTLRFKVKTNEEEKIIFETHDFPLQRWNNIVINYDHGTLDIFINAELVASIPSIIPDMKFASVRAGAKDGISGGICNVVYFSGNLSKDRIEFYYKLFNTQRFPVLGSPIDQYINKPLKDLSAFYHEHRSATIILAAIGFVIIPVIIWRKSSKSKSTAIISY